MFEDIYENIYTQEPEGDKCMKRKMWSDIAKAKGTEEADECLARFEARQKEVLEHMEAAYCEELRALERVFREKEAERLRLQRRRALLEYLRSSSTWSKIRYHVEWCRIRDDLRRLHEERSETLDRQTEIEGMLTRVWARMEEEEERRCLRRTLEV
ncbi:hypothetical protein EJ06DRAFT_532569 [Trichodelitschia bisporula]|uniref:Uncharacterized protein n=1 Tax=Trichodelitschia bisporula TaxID=703511 RepID=A0A6G1HQ75_9PEZI|nr:hypothetical protein EJ06DRAFT_532569 [Trichodelitschia bisporula]